MNRPDEINTQVWIEYADHIEQQNKALKEYAKHKNGCKLLDVHHTNELHDCSCGLDKLRK